MTDNATAEARETKKTGDSSVFDGATAVSTHKPIGRGVSRNFLRMALMDLREQHPDTWREELEREVQAVGE